VAGAAGEGAGAGGVAGDGGALPRTGSIIEDATAAITSMENSYVAVQGPPGSGKTYSGSRIIRALVERHGWRVGVVAQSHAVVENMLAGVVKAGLDPARVGKDKVKHPAPTWTAGALPAFMARHGSGYVVGGTAWDFTNAGTVPRGELDLLVVDEAGQFSLGNTIAVSVAARRLLLLGDPQQLPQVSQGTHAEPVDTSALGWLMAGHATLPARFGYFLAQSYRMHPEVCRRVSVLSYDGELTSTPQASARSLEGVAPGVEVVMVDHAGNRTESAEEAAAVVDLVRAHLGRVWRDPDDSGAPRALREEDVLVVAPYNAQVQMVREALVRAGYGGVRVGTVDKFQGQEAPLAVISMAASSHGDVPRGMPFLLNRNRLNVGVSRAQWKSVVVRSEALTAYMPATAGELLELGAFIGVCEGA
ncbi:MAG TPA: AAA family ATPase, partial [Actinomycetales bacterium]|nr:AAA family ATPase [Actinomycetales bacterium]